MKKIIVLALSGVLFLFSFTSAQNEEGGDSQSQAGQDKVIAAIKEKAESIDSFKADFNVQVAGEGEDSSTKGELIFKRPNKSILRGITIITLNDETKVMDQQMVSDGNILWHYIPETKTVMKLKLDENSPALAGDEIINPFLEIENGSLVYKGIENVSGNEFYSFEGKSANPDLEQEKILVKLLFYKDSYLLYRKVSYDQATGGAASRQYENISTGVEAEDSDFNFILPENVTVNDLNESR